MDVSVEVGLLGERVTHLIKPVDMQEAKEKAAEAWAASKERVAGTTEVRG